MCVKGKTVKGMKAQKAMEVAWCYTKEEIAEWRRERKLTDPPALMVNRGSRQPTLDDFFSRVATSTCGSTPQDCVTTGSIRNVAAFAGTVGRHMATPAQRV